MVRQRTVVRRAMRAAQPLMPRLPGTLRRRTTETRSTRGGTDPTDAGQVRGKALPPPLVESDAEMNNTRTMGKPGSMFGWLIYEGVFWCAGCPDTIEVRRVTKAQVLEDVAAQGWRRIKGKWHCLACCVAAIKESEGKE